MKSTTYLLILNMACGDLVISTCTGVMLIRYLLFTSVWPLGRFGILLCKTSLYIALVSFLACFFSLVGITVDRFMAVSRPLKHKPCSKWTKIAIPVIWATSFLLPVGTLLEIDEIPNQSANFMILAFSTAVYVNVSSLSLNQLSSLEEEGPRRNQRPATANSKSHSAKSHIYDDHSDSHLFHMLGATICFFVAASIC